LHEESDSTPVRVDGVIGEGEAEELRGTGRQLQAHGLSLGLLELELSELRPIRRNPNGHRRNRTPDDVELPRVLA